MWRLSVISEQPRQVNPPPHTDLKAIAVFMTGCLCGTYLVFAGLMLPGGRPEWGGGSIVVQGLIFSYWGIAIYSGFFGTIVLPAFSYGIYALIAYWRKRELGLRLFALHYAIALLISLLSFVFRNDEINVTLKQLHIFPEHPFQVAAVLVPFLLANVWYLWRLMRR